MTTRFRLEVGAATEVGRRRERNEDRYAAYVPLAEEDSELAGLLLVADGMGGERGGAEASRLTARRLLEELSSERRRRRGGDVGEGGLLEVLRAAIGRTSDEILRLGESDPALTGLGSTLVLAAFTGDRALIAHVGDSRCYRLRGGRLEQLTCDHTWVADQVEAGVMTEEEARHHPQRSVLTRTLGDAVAPPADVRSEALADGDLFILCSDGLTKALADSEILHLAGRFPRPQDLAEALVTLANDKDGSDNITAVACHCRDARLAAAEAEPDDTEPIERPEDLPRGPSSKSWLVAVAVFVVLLLLGLFGPRFYAVRAFEQGVEHARHGQYLHARQEFSKAIRLGLDRKRSEQLIDILLELPSTSRAEEAAGEAREPSAEGDPDAPN